MQKYLIQRFHPNLHIGFVPSVLNGKRLMPIHCQQGTWDSACGMHCAAIALALLGDIHDVAVLSERRNGVAARLWRFAQATYFDGVNVEGLASVLEDTGTGRHITYYSGGHAKCLAFVLSHFEQRELVIASWRSQQGHHHWTLIVGIEGLQTGHKFKPSTLLALDPGERAPQLCGYNGRLQFSVAARRKRAYHPYLSADGYEVAVKLTSALSIGTAQIK